VYVFEVVGTNQDVVSRDQMHYSQERRPRHIAGQACNHPCFQVNQHRIAETFVHECDPLVIRRNIGALSEVSKHLNVLRQVLDRILPLSFGGTGKKKHDTQWQKEFHAGYAI
jgi:hypothetical protein